MNEQKLQNIRQAEQSAKNLLISVDEMTKVIIHDSHNKVLEIMDEVKKLTREDEKKILSEYENKGNKKAHDILSELDRELKEIDNSADHGESEAILFLKDQMKVSYGNS